MKRTYVTDVEIYKNYLLISFLNIANDKIVAFEAVPGEQIDVQKLARMMKSYRTVGFNTINFDLLIIYGAIAGLSIAELKEMADDIIHGGMKPWDIERRYGFKVPRDLDHVDLIEVAPGKASLKIYNGRLHGKRMQDLPIEPNAVLTLEEMDEIFDYNINDLQATKLLFEKLLPQIALRETMSEEYEVNLLSKSDAQVAEAVIRAEVARLLDDVPARPTIAPGTSYRYDVPDFIRFEHPALLDILDEIIDTRFRVSEKGSIVLPKSLAEAHIEIGKGVYRMGIGGLHSSESQIHHVAGSSHIIVDRDVSSYYPIIIINQGLHPEHLGWAFLKVYKRIVARRLKGKEHAAAIKAEIDAVLLATVKSNCPGPALTDDKIAELKAELQKWVTVADSLKITINGSFGKFGSKWSFLYSPNLLIQTTLTGQLSLLMLIERLEAAGIRVVSANTDGIVIRCHKSKIARMDAIVAQWEGETEFATEATEYDAIYSRDVNNYVAVKKGGGVKLKGAYAPAGLMKNPTNEICVEAAVAKITSCTPVSKTIRACRDITKFVTVRTVKGGAVWGAREVVEERFSAKGRQIKSKISFDVSEGEYLGKAIRWYYSADVEGAIHYKAANTSGNHNKVPRSDGARPLMEIPDEFPEDLDYRWYIDEANSILEDLSFYEAAV